MNYDRRIHQYLRDNNIRTNKIGYLYLVYAIQSGLNQLENIYFAVKLYETIGQEFKASIISVERAIRTAVLPTGLTSKEFITDAVYNILCGAFQPKRPALRKQDQK